jgi:N-acetylglucosaminyl-diphospho-decaprenol L-rhamnosyltransferase
MTAELCHSESPNAQGTIQSASTRPLVSVVIVTYNSRKLVDRCLEPLTRPNSEDIEVIVVDNCSSDDTVSHVVRKYPGVHVIRSKSNIGFAGGNNLGFRQCRAAFVLMLNPDAFVDGPEQIRHMVRRLQERPDIAALGPRLVHNDGSHQVGDAGWGVRLRTVTAHMFFLQRLLPSIPSLYLSSPALLERDEVAVDWVCGACTLVRKSIIDMVGGLDERIFMYGEDVEFGTRVRNYGYGILYLPRIVVIHLQGATQKGDANAYYSTKWIDSLADTFLTTSSYYRFPLFKAVMAAGFLLRSAIYFMDWLLRRNKTSKTRSYYMWKYTVHVLRFCSRTMSS